MSEKTDEIIEELREFVVGRVNLIDALVPPLVFVIANIIWGVEAAAASGLVLSGLIAGYRVLKGQPVRFALLGLVGVGIASAIVYVTGQPEIYFASGLLQTFGLSVLALVSVLFKRPMVAWTSFIARRWPLEWYWHPKVRPAYSEVTLLWALFFGMKGLLAWGLFSRGETTLLGIAQILTGWPATIMLLIASYMYGQWRLRVLEGPSVAELAKGAKSPWKSQRRGF